MAGGKLSRFKRSWGQQGREDVPNDQEGNLQPEDGSPFAYLNLDHNDEAETEAPGSRG
jgi:hypothetical protein